MKLGNIPMSNEIFIIDSDALIRPYRFFYPFDMFPDFWNFIEREISVKNIKILDMVYDEIATGGDALSNWFSGIKDIEKIERREISIINSYSNILKYIQNCGLYKINALNSWSTGTVAHPWIIATAHSLSYTVITFETSNAGLSKNQQSKDAKIPDICKQFNVKCNDLYYMMRKLGFRKIDG